MKKTITATRYVARQVAWSIIGFGSINALRLGGPKLHRRYCEKAMPIIDFLLRDFRKQRQGELRGVSGS